MSRKCRKRFPSTIKPQTEADLCQHHEIPSFRAVSRWKKALNPYCHSANPTIFIIAYFVPAVKSRARGTGGFFEEIHRNPIERPMDTAEQKRDPEGLRYAYARITGQGGEIGTMRPAAASPRTGAETAAKQNRISIFTYYKSKKIPKISVFNLYTIQYLAYSNFRFFML